MEELLNKLIEKGWDVFPDTKFFWNKDKLRFSTFSKWKKRIWFWNDDYTYRELVSKESWLWQFVCENGMVALKLSARMKNPRIDFEDADDYNNWHIVMNYKQKCEWDKAEYRIIESALCDEDKLEKFLLDNIKV